MKCFYHSADLDGHCSGAIVKKFNPACEMIGINYGQEFPWEKIKDGETVFLVDFTLQPFEQMERLDGMCALIWIDHHKTEIEEAFNRGFGTLGIQRVGIGACALVWEWFTRPHEEEDPLPEAVRLLAEYDVWNHSDPKTLPFQYGFRMNEDTRPDNQVFWDDYLDGSFTATDYAADIGKTILKYEEGQNAKFCRAYAFETELNGLKAICCNRGFTNSKVFDSVWDQKKYDLMLTFVRLKPPANKWTVSLYSTKPGVDCGVIARQHGGGGHVGAAGFQCEVLPFRY